VNIRAAKHQILFDSTHISGKAPVGVRTDGVYFHPSPTSTDIGFRRFVKLTDTGQS
jgi:hypothetical protein